MSSIKIDSSLLHKKCCIFLVWYEVVFRQTQAIAMKERLNFFIRTYEKAYCSISEHNFSNIDYAERWWYREIGVKKLLTLCKFGNPVELTTEHSFVLKDKFLDELHLTEEQALLAYDELKRKGLNA